MPNTFNEGHLGKRGTIRRAGDWAVGRVYTWEVSDAKALFAEKANRVQDLKGIIDHRIENGLEISDSLKKDFQVAAREYHMSRKGVEYATHGVGATFEGMFKRMAEVVGVDTSRWGSVKVKGDLEAQINHTMSLERNTAKRIFSKPFRMVNSLPGLALAAGGIAAVIGVGGVMHRRAEAQTQQDAMRQAAEIEAQHAQAQMAQMQQLQLLQQQQQQPNVNVTVQPQPQPTAPAPQINVASPKVQAGNDNIKYEGTVQTPQLAAAL